MGGALLAVGEKVTEFVRSAHLSFFTTSLLACGSAIERLKLKISISLSNAVNDAL
jgi:hypothetical protein